MENKSRCDDIVAKVIDPQAFIETLNDRNLMILVVELDMLMNNYNRTDAIAYLSANYSSNKHLCTTVLNGLHDEEIKVAMKNAHIILDEEVARRKK